MQNKLRSIAVEDNKILAFIIENKLKQLGVEVVGLARSY